jgi:hypothetical protein
MNVVIYTADFEPITVLDLPPWLLDQMEKVGGVRIAVQDPVKDVLRLSGERITMPELKTVHVLCEKLRWRDGTLKPILVTPDEELALMLRPEWLPGQRAAINNYKGTISYLTSELVKAMRKN